MSTSKNNALAEALVVLGGLQKKSSVISLADVSSTQKNLLLQNGFLQQINRGWFAISHPQQPPGDTTVWASCFWDFCQRYMEDRFGDGWCLSPIDSARLLTGASSVPRHIVCYASQGNNQPVTVLSESSSIFIQRKNVGALQPYSSLSSRGVRHLSCEFVLVKLSAEDMRQDQVTTAVLLQQASLDRLAQIVIEEGNATSASRLVGAYQAVGREEDAERLRGLWRPVFDKIHASNPFLAPPPDIKATYRHPVSARLNALWQNLRPVVLEHAPEPSSAGQNPIEILAHIDDIYTQDCYHSLSIEGYKVTEELIERVRSGQWNSQTEDGKNSANAMAAKGYYDAFQEVRGGVERVLAGEQAATDMLIKGYRPWKERLFSPSVQAGLIKQIDVVGFRRHPVFLRGSRHVPVSYEALGDAMGTFDHLIQNEENPFVRSVLGHLFLGYIHPFFDGNGRTARLFMNASLSVSGYPWIITKFENRTEYLAALESASVDQDVAPFAKFVAAQINDLTETHAPINRSHRGPG